VRSSLKRKSNLDPEIVAQRIKLAQETNGGLAMPPPPPAAFGVTEQHDVEWLSRRLTPHPLNSYQVPIRLDHPVGNGIAKTYIVVPWIKRTAFFTSPVDLVISNKIPESLSLKGSRLGTGRQISSRIRQFRRIER
jgi:hypothetical protein